MLARTKLISAAAALSVAVLLAGCGGGDNSSGPPDGGWVGTTTSNRDLTAVVLSDGAYYLMYSAVGDPSTVGGVVQGTAAISGESFTSSDALDFNVEGAGAKPGAVAASLHPWDKFEGSFAPTTTGNAMSFQTRFDVIKTPGGATLAQLAGAYDGHAGFALGVRPAVFTVTAAGAVSSSINGCAITGTATPRTDINGYDLNIAFGASPCLIPGLSFTGIAYVRQDNGRLYAAARNAATKQSVIFSGSKS
jgi:hypothetical protein